MRFVYSLDAFYSCLFSRNTPGGIKMAWTSIMDEITNQNIDHKRGNSTTCTKTQRVHPQPTSAVHDGHKFCENRCPAQCVHGSHNPTRSTDLTFNLNYRRFYSHSLPGGQRPDICKQNLTVRSISVSNWVQGPFRKCVSIQLYRRDTSHTRAYTYTSKSSVYRSQRT